MGSQLDLDDVTADHPLAKQEMTALRARVAELERALSGMGGCTCIADNEGRTCRATFSDDERSEWCYGCIALDALGGEAALTT